MLCLLLVNEAGENLATLVCATVGTHTVRPSQLTALRAAHKVNCTQGLMRAPPATAGLGYSTFRNSTHFIFLFVSSNTRCAYQVRLTAGYFVHYQIFMVQKISGVLAATLYYSGRLLPVKTILIRSDNQLSGQYSNAPDPPTFQDRRARRTAFIRPFAASLVLPLSYKIGIGRPPLNFLVEKGTTIACGNFHQILF
jgi:hypothetical protein